MNFLVSHQILFSYHFNSILLNFRGEEEVKRVKGYYRKGCPKSDSGRLSIEAMNLPDFYNLIKQAKKEADQLNKTLGRLENFELNIDFSVGETTSSES